MDFKEDLDAANTGNSQVVKTRNTRSSMSVHKILQEKKEKHEARESARSSGVSKKKALEIKMRSAKVRNFINKAAEVRNLIRVSDSISSNNEEMFYKNAAAYFKLQEKVKGTILELFLVDEFDKEMKRSGYALGEMIGTLIEEGVIRSHDKERLSNIVDIIVEINSSSPVMSELYEESRISSDTLVNIKCSIMPYAIKMEQVLHEMNLNQSEKLQQIRWLHTKSISLAKDIAFNWDKHSGFREREVIFENMLKDCCEIVYKTWIDIVIMEMKSEYTNLDKESVLKRLPKFRTAVQKKHMGYALHKELSIEWLEQQIFQVVVDHINSSKISLFTNKENGIYASFILFNLDEKLEEIWNIESTKHIENFTKMSQEEKEAWAKSKDANKPMPIDDIIKLVGEYFKNDLPAKINIKSKDELKEKSSNRRFALLWGMSNAICQKKNN